MRRWIKALHKWGKNNVHYWPLFRSDIEMYANRESNRGRLVELISYLKGKVDHYNEQAAYFADQEKAMRYQAECARIMLNARVIQLEQLEEEEDNESL